jgi:hypothetical protein
MRATIYMDFARFYLDRSARWRAEEDWIRAALLGPCCGTSAQNLVRMCFGEADDGHRPRDRSDLENCREIVRRAPGHLCERASALLEAWTDEVQREWALDTALRAWADGGGVR